MFIEKNQKLEASASNNREAKATTLLMLLMILIEGNYFLGKNGLAELRGDGHAVTFLSFHQWAAFASLI
jgi:hypothetical protein